MIRAVKLWGSKIIIHIIIKCIYIRIMIWDYFIAHLMMLWKLIFLDIFDNNFLTTWVGYPGVVRTDSTFNCYWYLKEEVKDEYIYLWLLQQNKGRQMKNYQTSNINTIQLWEYMRVSINLNWVVEEQHLV